MGKINGKFFFWLLSPNIKLDDYIGIKGTCFIMLEQVLKILQP